MNTYGVWRSKEADVIAFSDQKKLEMVKGIYRSDDEKNKWELFYMIV